MPALKKAEKDIVLAGIGYATPEEWFGDVSKVSEETIKEQQERERAKAQTFIDAYGGKIYGGYKNSNRRRSDNRTKGFWRQKGILL